MCAVTIRLLAFLCDPCEVNGCFCIADKRAQYNGGSNDKKSSRIAKISQANDKRLVNICADREKMSEYTMTGFSFWSSSIHIYLRTGTYLIDSRCLRVHAASRVQLIDKSVSFAFAFSCSKS